MAAASFEKVRLLLGEPNRDIRRTLHGAMRDRGFRAVQEADSVRAVESAVARNRVDVLICDMDLQGGDLCDLIYRVRHNEVGNNPFLVMIMVTSDGSAALVRRVIDSGSDDLVIKPFNIGQLCQRIENLADARKPFVVTSDYIGPDRRAGDRPGAKAIPRIEVPNPLRDQGKGNANRARLQAAIDAATATINEQKVERHSDQIVYLVRNITAAYRNYEVNEQVRALLERLLYVGQDIGRRMATTKYAPAAELCGTVAAVSQRILEAWKVPDPKNLDLLAALAQAIEQAFKLKGDAAEFARDITESINRRYAMA